MQIPVRKVRRDKSEECRVQFLVPAKNFGPDTSVTVKLNNYLAAELVQHIGELCNVSIVTWVNVADVP